MGVSNQPAAAKGVVSVRTARRHSSARARAARPQEDARFDDFRLCLHHPAGVVPELTRGSATAASRHRECCSRPLGSWASIWTASWMIGDTDGDVLAGRAAGCRTVLIEHAAERAQAQRSCATRRASARPGGSRHVASAGGASKLTPVIDELNVKIFADGADLDAILALAADRRIARLHDESDADVEGRPDRLRGVRQAPAGADHRRIRSRSRCSPTTPTRCAARRCMIAAWGENVYVKIPVSTTSASRWRRSCASSPRAA